MRSPKLKEIFLEKVKVALPRPVVTRWNSLYDALTRIVKLREKIVEISPQIGIKNILSDLDFRYIEGYLKILKPIAETLDLLQGETVCHYGSRLSSLVSLKVKLKALESSQASTRYAPLISGLLKSLENRFKSFFDLEDGVAGAAIAACSHPRFKKRWLAPFSEPIRRRVDDFFLRAATEEYNKLQVIPQVPIAADPSDDFFDFGEEAEEVMHIESVSVEIAKYMANSSTDLGMLENFPVIKKLFIRFNTPLPSSAPVERLLSFATMIDLPKWNRLSDNHFEQRVLMKANAIKASSAVNPRQGGNL